LGIPLCVDLYAPRLLEAAFQGGTANEAINSLRAIAAGDEFLFSNRRQRWFYLGLLALAGVDIRQVSGHVVPLVAPKGPRRRKPNELTLVMGGVSWPWQDPTEGLRKAVAALESLGTGRVIVYGGRPTLGDAEVVDLPALVPPCDRLIYAGALPWPKLLKAYAGATAALDVMAPNPEREVSLAFRHVDYLGCGLPLITGPHHALADALDEAGAGWLVDGDPTPVIEALSADPWEAVRRGKAAKALARKAFGRTVCEAPLLAWVDRATVREHSPSPLPRAAELAAELAEARGAQDRFSALLEKAHAEVEEKRAEVSNKTGQIQDLITTTRRLADAVADVAQFRAESTRVLGAGRDAARDEARSLAEENADLRADLAKKDAALKNVTQSRDRLMSDIRSLQDNLADQEMRLAETNRREEALRTRTGSLRADLSAVRAERDRVAGDGLSQIAANADLVKRLETLQEAVEQKIQQVAEANGELHRMYDRAGRFESDIERLNTDLNALRSENERLSKRRFL
jgi:predicted  nucleic acid-binding Zn-ribbon protein